MSNLYKLRIELHWDSHSHIAGYEDVFVVAIDLDQAIKKAKAFEYKYEDIPNTKVYYGKLISSEKIPEIFIA